MNVQKTLLFTLSLLLSAIAFDGCSSLATQTPRFRTETAEKPRQQLPEKKSEIIQPVALDTSYFVNLQRLESGLNDDSTKIDDEQYAKEIALLLERARTYYIGALDAHTKEDSLNASEKFEAAITILNELSSMPQIENNTEFNDISKSVIEDYEKYIANVDSLGQNSSVFALREKLNQFLSAETAPSDGIAKEHIKGTTIPLVINGHVEKNIYYLQKKAPHHFKFWMEQSGRYFPVFEPILKEVGVPEELKYLAMIESGMNPRARSWAKAVGMWQFIKGTGKLYGLSSTYWTDDRRDVEKSTRAAARHLKDLYRTFGDWHLALAAYNSGEGRVNRAIRRSGSRSFWGMWEHLPRETRNYVPAFIATVLMGRNPEKYGFQNLPSLEPLQFDTVHMNESVDLSVLAECGKTTVDNLQELNPSLLRFATPPAPFTLRIPEGNKDFFRRNYAEVPQSAKRQWLTHTIRKGETLKKIARRYGVSSTDLAEANRLSLTAKLRTGKELLVPISQRELQLAEKKHTQSREKNATQRIAKDHPIVTPPTGKETVVHLIRSGETLGEIAEEYNVRISDLRNWNNIPFGKQIRAGKTLVVYIAKQPEKTTAQETIAPPEKKSKPLSQNKTGWIKYTVKNGDVLLTIAQQYGIEVQDIKQWNALRTSRINVGQQLELYIENENGKQKSPTSIVKTESDDAEKTNGKKMVVHKVRRGDTLYDIAKKYGVQLVAIKEWNNLSSSKLKIGMALRLFL